MAQRENIEFKTLDGLTLRGWLYPATEKGPAVILNPGFNCVKEMFVPEVAEYFQKSNITALTYDPRTLGDSEGTPRNDLDPVKQAGDYHDALTFLKQHPLVDPDKVVYWGFSFAGQVALSAAALDKRAKLVIAVAPLTVFEFPVDKWPKVLAKALQDRESQLKGNPPFYLPVLTEKGENPAGFGIGTAKEDFKLILGAKTLAPNYDNRTTIQTYYRIAAWQPLELAPFVSPTPVLLVTPENDQISLAANQKKLFDKFSSPSEHHIVKDKGHMDVLAGEDFSRVMDLQVDFIRKHV
ncbi:Thiohydrolase [Cladobotryum mycophilum]|uniref:Thiohydrolase n=1 Tax=Cladobotryum mycophilum TaxID=491253 RepID=A0ABR0SIM5_9HYPO